MKNIDEIQRKAASLTEQLARENYNELEIRAIGEAMKMCADAVVITKLIIKTVESNIEIGGENGK